MIAVMAIVGMLAGVAVVRYGDSTLGVTQGEGYARKISQALQVARRHAITTGQPAALRFERSDGAVTGFDLVRVDGGDLPIETFFEIPSTLAVTTTTDRWEFGYDGALNTPAIGGTILVTAGGNVWSIDVYALSGSVQLSGS